MRITMCFVSVVMQQKYDEWYKRYWPNGWQGNQPPALPNPFIGPAPAYPQPPHVPMPTQIEIDEFRRLLERAREYDKKYNQPDCEMDEKRDKLKALAKE